MSLLKKKLFDFNRCYNQSAAGDCNLIQKLKELQAQKREAGNKIDAYTKHSKDIVSNFIVFLRALERQGCFDFCRSSKIYDFKSGIELHLDSHGTSKLERALENFSTNDIQTLCDELKALSYKKSIVDEQSEISKRLDAEIQEIKGRLGIE